MTHVQECIDLYLTDEQVTDAQFRAVLLDARARDIDGGTADPLDELRVLLAEHGHALVLLNRVDDLRAASIAAHEKRLHELTGFADSLAGQVRVLRERLDNVEGR